MPTKRQIADMKDFIDATMESLGSKIQWKSESALQFYRKGAPLLLKELRQLPDDTPVWVVYKEYGERSFRINRAMRISRDELSGKDCWMLLDGSSWGAEFCATCGPDDHCFDCHGDCGEMLLYVAEPKARRKSAGSARTRRRR